MTRRFNGRPALPPDAKDEILHVLFANMEISGDEIAAILKKHHVSCDADVLQDRYRRQLGQRLMASLRDASGEREVLSNGRGRYVVLECCRDPTACGHPPPHSKSGAWPERFRRQGESPHRCAGSPDRLSQKGGVT